MLGLMALAAQPAQAQEPGVTWDHRPTIVLGETSRIEIKGRIQSDFLVRDEADPDTASLGFDDRLSLTRKRDRKSVV